MEQHFHWIQQIQQIWEITEAWIWLNLKIISVSQACGCIWFLHNEYSLITPFGKMILQILKVLWIPQEELQVHDLFLQKYNVFINLTISYFLKGEIKTKLNKVK